MAVNTDYLERCLLTLEHSLAGLNHCKAGSIDYEVYRNATIKGFELTLEVAGKLLKKALVPYYPSSRQVDKLYFKELFRAGAKHGLLTTDEVERWFAYRDNRNSTAHDYGEQFAEETLQLISSFIGDVKSLVTQLQSE